MISTHLTDSSLPSRPAARTAADALAIAFHAFATLRVVAYLPTAWSIVASADSAQHSLFTWLVFAGANATLGLRLWRDGGRRVGACVAVSAVNTTMCLLLTALIVWYRT